MTSGFFEQTWPMVEVNDYHLIFNLNGVFVVIVEGQIRSRLIILKLGLKEFLFACVKKFLMYIWSLAMRRNFSKNLDIIAKKNGVLFLFCKILDQTLYFRNDHILLGKFDKPVFHKNLNDFFHLFLSMTFENTLLIDDMLCKEYV
jgi:hypothetical protein